MSLFLNISLPPGRTMRRYVALTALVAGLFPGMVDIHAASVSPAPSENTREISHVSNFAAPILTESNATSILSIEGCETLYRAGEPSLPSRVVRLLLPPGHRLLRAEAKPVDAVAALKLDSKLALSGRTASRRGAVPARITSQPRWPAGRVEVASVQTLSGCIVAILRVFPITRGPSAGEWLFSPSLRITAIVEPAPSSRTALVPRDHELAARSVAAFVDNPETLAGYRAQWNRALAAQPAPEPLPERHDYLLITAARFLPSFQPLMDQKAREGLAARTETIESITTGFTGRDLPERIRNCIRHAFTNDGVQFVLLGGDVGIVPCRYAFVPRQLPEPECLVPADLYYACLDGSWNRNGDKRWGESEDGEDGGEVDLLAEVAVGRATVETEAEVRAFVAKTIQWTGAAPAVHEHVLLLSTALEQGKAQGGAMFDPLVPLFQRSTLTWLDDRPGIAPRWKSSEALAALNRSPCLVCYSGHGAADALMRLSSPDLSKLTNAVPFLLASVGCHAGEFDNPSLSPDCIGEQMLTRETGGAVAAILNARAGWYDAHDEIRYSGEFQSRLVRRLLKPAGARLGAIHQSAKQDLSDRVERTGSMAYRWCYYGLNLLGDPHLSVSLNEERRAVLGLKTFPADSPQAVGITGF